MADSTHEGDEADFATLPTQPLSNSALSKLSAEALAQITAEKQQLIRYRFWLFVGSGGVALALLGVLVCLATYYFRERFLLDLALQAGWQALVAADAIFVMLTVIVLSIFWGLVKIVRKEQDKETASENDLLGAVTKAASSLKDLIETIQGALRGK